MTATILEPSTRLRFVAYGVAVGVAYFAAARLGLALSFQQTNVSPVWPPAGVGLAAILMLGGRAAPAIFLGAFLANYVAFHANPEISVGSGVAVGAVIGVGNTLEALFGARILRRLAGGGRVFDHAHDGIAFLVAATASCTVAAVVGSTALCVGLPHVVPWALHGTILFTWWLGDVGGMLVVAPLIVFGLRRSPLAWTFGRRLEALLLVACLVLVHLFLVSGWVRDSITNSLHYLSIPFLLWIALRLGHREAAVGIVATTALAVWSTVHGYGPFVRESLNESLLLLQAFVCVTAVTINALAAAVTERRRAEVRLREANSSLERRVEERTQALAATNESLRDEIAERARTEQELRMAKDAADVANEGKTHFLANMSHELRTPLNSVIGFANLLQKNKAGNLSDKDLALLERISANGGHLLTIVGNILDLTKVEAGELHTETETVSLGALAADVVEQLGGAAAGKPVTVSADCRVADANVETDPVILRQILINIVGNAIKFTHEGSVTVLVDRNPDPDHPYRIDVVDTGIGIAEADQPHVFGTFLQADNTIARRFGGTGLGLTLAREFGRLLNCQLRLRSVEGEGSTFSLLVPAAAPVR